MFSYENQDVNRELNSFQRIYGGHKRIAIGISKGAGGLRAHRSKRRPSRSRMFTSLDGGLIRMSSNGERNAWVRINMIMDSDTPSTAIEREGTSFL